MKSYYSGLSIRESCTLCDYARLSRIADITIGDYWNALFGEYSIQEIKKGVSLVLINNDKVHNIFEVLKDKLVYKSITLQEAIAKNTNIVSLGKTNQKRSEFLNEFVYSDVQYVINKYFHSTFKNRVAAMLSKSLIYGKILLYKIKAFAKIYKYIEKL
jgi:coenzyme F420-reducing hydrogenase beta subunit